jgi:lipoate-protein ligase A
LQYWLSHPALATASCFSRYPLSIPFGRRFAAGPRLCRKFRCSAFVTEQNNAPHHATIITGIRVHLFEEYLTPGWRGALTREVMQWRKLSLGDFRRKAKRMR